MREYSEREKERIEREFPNVSKEEFEFEAKRRLEDELCVWLAKSDWDEPSTKDVANLRGVCSSRDLDALGEGIECFGRDEIEAFADSDDFSQEYIDANIGLIKAIGGALSEEPFMGEDFLSIDKEHIVRITMSCGDMGSWIDFVLDSEGELKDAKASYACDFQGVEIPVDYDIAERLWRSFSCISDAIAANARSGNSMRNW